MSSDAPAHEVVPTSNAPAPTTLIERHATGTDIGDSADVMSSILNQRGTMHPGVQIRQRKQSA